VVTIQGAVNELIGLLNADDIPFYYKGGIQKVLETIQMDIEPKHGEWITIDTEVISVPVYWNEEQRQSDERGAGILEKCECSVCGWRTNFMGYKKLGANKSYNYCPNCGAHMKGVDDVLKSDR